MQSLVRKINGLVGITSKGQATMENSLPVTLAYNHSPLPTVQAIDSIKTEIRGIATIGSPPASIPPSSDRVAIYIQNAGSEPVYLGHDDEVSSSTGWKIPAGQSTPRIVDGKTTFWVKPETAGVDIRVIEEISEL